MTESFCSSQKPSWVTVDYFREHQGSRQAWRGPRSPRRERSYGAGALQTSRDLRRRHGQRRDPGQRSSKSRTWARARLTSAQAPRKRSPVQFDIAHWEAGGSCHPTPSCPAAPQPLARTVGFAQRSSPWKLHLGKSSGREEQEEPPPRCRGVRPRGPPPRHAAAEQADPNAHLGWRQKYSFLLISKSAGVRLSCTSGAGGGLVEPLCLIIHKLTTLSSHVSVVLSKLPRALTSKPVRALAGGTLRTV